MNVMYKKYEADIWGRNSEGSNRADSYLRALKYLGPILADHSKTFAQCADLFSISDSRIIRKIYEYVCEQQKLGECGIFHDTKKPSYWKSRFYSAALKDYMQFLVQFRYEEKLWKIYNTECSVAKEIAKNLSSADVGEYINLFDLDVDMPQGKDVLREVKTRLNQHFFRSMIIQDYSSCCCLTGLSVPAVLRASHIIPWAKDERNRMNPGNGLCLSATYDAAFDRHLISFDENYRFILSKSLKEYYTDQAFKTHFLSFEGVALTFPKRFKPEQEFLEKHRNAMQ
jgi:putative restriction endonuclease